MMEHDLLRDLVAKLRKPAFVIILLVIAGLVVNIMLLVLFIVPDLFLKENQQSALNAKQKQVDEWMARPLPALASPADFRKLYGQLPSQPDTAGFVLHLRELELTTGVTLSSVGFGKGSGPSASNLESELAKATSANGNSSGAQPSPSPQTSYGTGFAENKPKLVQQEEASLTISGTYAQSIDFINRLRLLERIATLNEWDMVIGSASSRADNSSLSGLRDETDQTITTTIKLTIYYSKAMEPGESGSATGQTKRDASVRSGDPTLSDAAFRDILGQSGHTTNP
ncbi:hypothetical protein [Paenibacillus sp. MBLB4367]|uniref:hypothetical protein n=1 Tax=Paenibacillus sp. MBLB4367 TaxID=3384767 RepID=UPI0039080DDE